MIIDPNPIAPMKTIEPKCPIIILSTRPTNGMVIFEIMSGRAIPRVFLSKFENLKNNFYDISIMSKSDFDAPHSGQAQFSETSSHLVPGSMPSSGHPSASS